MSLCGWVYRKFQEFMHRRDWHHMKKSGPFEDGSRQRWCHWCGLRVTIPAPNPMSPYKLLHDLRIAAPRAGVYLTNIKDYTV